MFFSGNRLPAPFLDLAGGGSRMRKCLSFLLFWPPPTSCLSGPGPGESKQELTRNQLPILTLFDAAITMRAQASASERAL